MNEQTQTQTQTKVNNTRNRKQSIFDPIEYNQLLDYAKENHLKIVHYRLYNEEGEICTKGGATAVIGKKYKHSKVAKLSIALCSSNDDFQKKIGTFLSLKSFKENRSVPIVVNNENSSQVAMRILESILI